MKLEGKTAIVTGAGRGIGRAIAICLAEEGADVAVCSRTLSELEEVADVVRALGRKSLAIRVDATYSKQVDQMVRKTLDTFGQIDILVNNAGGSEKHKGKSRNIEDLTDENWDDSFQVNLKSHVYFCRAVVPHMKVRGSGKIVNISSVAGKLGDGNQLPYSSIKGAVVVFTRALARQLAPNSINVNCICPGFIYTPLWQQMSERLWQTVPAYQKLKDPKDVFLRRISKLVPMQREQTEEDIGRAVVFLTSEDAKNITGQSINIDGGMVME